MTISLKSELLLDFVQVPFFMRPQSQMKCEEDLQETMGFCMHFFTEMQGYGTAYRATYTLYENLGESKSLLWNVINL